MPRQSSQAAIDEAVKAIRTAAREIGYERGKYGELVRLARELESRGVHMPSGGQWYHEKGGATGLKRFLKLYAPDILEIGETPQFTAEQAGLAPEAETFQSEPVEQRTAAQDKSSEIAGPQFAAETAQTLLEVAHWWKEKGSARNW